MPYILTMNDENTNQDCAPLPNAAQEKAESKPAPNGEGEHGGFKSAGLKEPTRFGDWEVNGRCSDF